MFQCRLTDTFPCASSGRITVVKLNKIIYQYIAVFAVLAKGILNDSEMQQQLKWKYNSVACFTGNAGPLKVQSAFLIFIFALNLSFRNVILLGLPSIIYKLWLKQYFLVFFYFRAECSSVWNNLQKEIKALIKSDPVDVTKCIYFKLSSCKDEIQQREAKEHLQVHLEETLGSCVLCSVFTGLLLLVTERQDAKTGQEIFFFPFYGSFQTKKIILHGNFCK